MLKGADCCALLECIWIRLNCALEIGLIGVELNAEVNAEC